MFTITRPLCATMFTLLATGVFAQESPPGLTTTDEVRSEISEAMDAVLDYSAQERDAALTSAREAIRKLDAEIERQEYVLRENWSDMTVATREFYSSQMRELREARNTIGERFGALQAGGASAWDELKAGFASAWEAFSIEWSEAEHEDTAG